MTTFGYNANGSLEQQVAAGGVTTYGWDARGRLGDVTLPGGSVSQFGYDSMERRSFKRVDGTESSYVQDGHVTYEVHGTGGVAVEYVWATDGFTPLMQHRGTQTYWYHTDHLGTPWMMTDGGGGVVWRAKYKPFGKAEVLVSGVENPVRFPGQFEDETGLHYNWHRYYDPEVGRYVRVDPALLKSISMWLFVGTYPPEPYGLRSPYVPLRNNPTLYDDPTGTGEHPCEDQLRWDRRKIAEGLRDCNDLCPSDRVFVQCLKVCVARRAEQARYRFWKCCIRYDCPPALKKRVQDEVFGKPIVFPAGSPPPPQPKCPEERPSGEKMIAGE